MNTKNFVLASLVYLVSTLSLKAQLTIDNTTYTPTTLVSNLLLPSGSSTSVSNVNFSGVYNVSSRYQVGAFTTSTSTQTQMGFSGGILLTSGNTSEIPLTLGTDPRTTQVSRNYVSCTAGEIRKTGTCPSIINDLNVLSGGYNYFNTAVLEFDFVAAGDAVSFRYIFGSEEYQDNSGLINYQCSDYNDRFGFLLSGPGVSGGQGYTSDAKNIARLQNGSIVSINGVNNGVVGSSGGAPNASKCLAANPSWSSGSVTAEYLGTINGTQMNGNTKILTAYQSGLTVGATYHIKLIVMDVFDGAYDSAVYLEGGSFTSEATPLPVELESMSGFCNKEGIELQWRTNSERNNDFFTVEKYDQVQEAFAKIATVDATGYSVNPEDYSFIDFTTESGVNIYRLSQTDLDGTSEILKTIAVNQSCLETSEFTCQFSENGEIYINYNGEHDRSIHARLVDLNGKVLDSFSLKCEPNSRSLVNAISTLSNSVYYLQIESNQGVEEFKLVKAL